MAFQFSQYNNFLSLTSVRSTFYCHFTKHIVLLVVFLKSLRKNMQFTAILLVATSLLASSIFSNPITPRKIEHEPVLPRAIKSHKLRFCADIGYKGYCEDIEMPNGQCVNLPSNLSRKVSSVRIPHNTHCQFVDANDCSAERCAGEGHCASFDHDRAWLKGCGGWILGKAWNGCSAGWNDRLQSAKCYTKY